MRDFDGVRQPNTIYAASVSRGKDSTAMLRAIQLLGYPLDMIVSVDIWATDTIPAELPPMVAFKDEWDRKCLEHFGVPVTRLCAERNGKKLTYNDIFYRTVSPERERERESEWVARGVLSIYGFPLRQGAWCNGRLKVSPMEHLRLPDARRKLVQHAQGWRCAASRTCGIDGVPANSKRRQAGGFRRSPGTRGRRQISFTTSALPPTSRSGLPGTSTRATAFCHSSISAGTRTYADLSHSISECYRRPTRTVRGTGAGSAITRRSIPCGRCGGSIQTYGNC